MHSQINLRSIVSVSSLLSGSPVYNIAASSDFAALPRLSACCAGRNQSTQCWGIWVPNTERRRNSGEEQLSGTV